MDSGGMTMTGFGFIGILFLFIGLGLLVLNIATSVWAYRDCLKRGKSSEFAVIVLLATLIFPIVGLIVYLIIRND
ncbi:hypothetical protein D3C73_484500 [compost metagenome]